MKEAAFNPENDHVNLELLAKLEVEGFITGLHKSPFHGFSVEFSEHKIYNAGENVKNIDWKLFAKTDKLYSKRFEEETNLRCQFVLDTSSSMLFPEGLNSKLNFSIQSIASLIFLLKRQRDAFGLSLFADQLYLNTKAKSTIAHQKVLFSYLEHVLADSHQGKGTDISNALHQIADQIHTRSLVVIFSDMLQAEPDEERLNNLFAAFQHLKFNKHEVVIFNVVDFSKEVLFNFDKRPHEFIDMESGKVVKVNSVQIKDVYLSQMNAYRKSIFLKCAQYKIDLIDADINLGVKPILQAYLIKRQKMN